GIKRKMSDDLAELFLAQAVIECPSQMTDELPFAAESDQGRASNQAAVALGETGTFPNLAEQDPFAEIDQAWNDVAHLLASGLLLRLSHDFLLFRSSGWIRARLARGCSAGRAGMNPSRPTLSQTAEVFP